MATNATIISEGPAPLSADEMKKRDKAVKKAEKRILQMRLISEANKKTLAEKSSAQSVIVTEPERKPAIEVMEDMKPAFQVGSYVMVEGDTSPGMNRPAGRGFVTSVSGCGAATISSVKYEDCYDNGRVHSDIPFSATTQVVYGQEFTMTAPKRRKLERTSYVPVDPPPNKVQPDNRSLYAVNKCQQTARDGFDHVDRATYTARLKQAKAEYRNSDSGTKAIWEAKRREHLSRQPAIKDQIVAAIRKNPNRSWKGIECDINYWCSDAAILTINSLALVGRFMSA